MTYTKKQFGLELKSKILNNYDCNEISKWAFKIYMDHGLELEKDLHPIVLRLMTMEEGPEFILSKEELQLLANTLVGEKI